METNLKYEFINMARAWDKENILTPRQELNP